MHGVMQATKRLLNSFFLHIFLMKRKIVPLGIRSLDVVHLFLIKQLLCFCNCLLISYSYFLCLKKNASLDIFF